MQNAKGGKLGGGGPAKYPKTDEWTKETASSLQWSPPSFSPGRGPLYLLLALQRLWHTAARTAPRCNRRLEAGEEGRLQAAHAWRLPPLYLPAPTLCREQVAALGAPVCAEPKRAKPDSSPWQPLAKQQGPWRGGGHGADKQAGRGPERLPPRVALSVRSSTSESASQRFALAISSATTPSAGPRQGMQLRERGGLGEETPPHFAPCWGPAEEAPSLPVHPETFPTLASVFLARCRRPNFAHAPEAR